MSRCLVVVFVAVLFVSPLLSSSKKNECFHSGNTPTSYREERMKEAYLDGYSLDTPPRMCGPTLSSPCHSPNSSLWTPDKDHFSFTNSNKPKDPDIWWKLIEEELQRSVAAARPKKITTRESAWKEMSKLASRFLTHHFIVYDNRMYMHKTLARPKGGGYAKSKKLASLMLEALKQNPEEFRNGGLLFSTDTRTGDLAKEPSPLVSIQKKYGYGQCGVLVPNAYFNEHPHSKTWGQFVEGLERASEANPWEKRHRQAFWIGSFSGEGPRPCEENFGNFARWQAITLNHTSNLVATGCFKGCDNQTLMKCKGKPHTPDPDPTMRYVRDNLETFSREGIEQRSFAEYRYLLSVPGAASGSYTRGLNVLWGMGSIVLMWNAPYVEWYFPALSHGNTHLSVTYNSLVPTLEWLEKNPKEVARLREGAKLVQEKLLCGECLGTYMRMAMKAIQEQYGMHLVLNDRKQALQFFRENYKCEDMIEFIGVKTQVPVNSSSPFCE